jgi:hypothetical protein
VVLLCLVVCRCIADSLLCYVGNWRYCGVLLGAGNLSATEGMCHWCVQSIVTLTRRCWRQQYCCVLHCRSVLPKPHCLVSLILRPVLRIEIIGVFNMKISFLWNVAPCGLV